MPFFKITASAGIVLLTLGTAAFAANPNSNGNGASGSNGNGGNSGNAGNQGAVAGTSQGGGGGGASSGQGQGFGLLRLLLTGSAAPESTGAPSGAGAPLSLEPQQAHAGPPSDPPAPRMSPVHRWALSMVEEEGGTPGYWHSLIGAGNSLNYNENADPSDQSRMSRIEAYYDAASDAAAALAALGGDLPTEEEYDDAVTLLDESPLTTGDADAIITAYEAGEELPDGTLPEDTDAYDQAYQDAQDYLEAELIVAAYEAEQEAIAAFEDADNQPYDEERRAAYDSLNEFLEASL